MFARVVFVLLGVSACSDRDCRLEQRVVEYVGATPHEDCGHFTGSNTSEAQYRAAHDCALSAYQAKHPFLVLWYLQGIEGVFRHAYAGALNDGRYEVVEFEQGFNVDTSLRPTRQSRCADVIDQGACSNVARGLCLECVVESIDDCTR